MNKIEKVIDLLKFYIQYPFAIGILINRKVRMPGLRFDQIFVKFHHHSVKSFHERDTRKIVKKLEGFGLHYFTLDTINYLFYW